MKKFKRGIFYILCSILLLIFPLTSFAHSGRTDSNGGHHDYQNKSGLGSYHYHHGMGPHLHPGGVCPYSGTSTDNSGNDSSSSQSSSYEPPSPSISIENYPDTLNVGESSGFEYSVSNATSESSTVTSSDTSVVKVGADKTLNAVGAGTAQITVTASGVTKTFTVRVTDVPVEEIKISNAIDKIQLGKDYKFETTILPENATNKKVTWSSDNTDILEIDNSGEIKAKSPGIVTVTAMTDNNIESKVSVEVFEVIPESIECGDSINLIVGDINDYKIDILPENSNNKEFKVSCDDEGILKYSESSVQAILEGETILHIETWNGIKKDIPVKIDILPVEKIEINDTTNYMFSNTIDKSDQVLISAKVAPGDATYQDIEWSSSDSNIIGIDNGKFIIKGTGDVILTCSAHGGIESSIKITVIDRSLFIVPFLLSAAVIITIIVFCIKRKHRHK